MRLILFKVFVLCLFGGQVACGPADGKYVDHYPNGAVKEEGFYKSGQKTGVWQFYWKDGTRKVLGTYRNGEPDGEWTFYDEQGQVLGKGVYRNGQMWDGRFVRYVMGTKKIIVVKDGQQAN